MGDEPAVKATQGSGDAVGGDQPGPGAGDGDGSLSIYVETEVDGRKGFFKDTQWSSGDREPDGTPIQRRGKYRSDQSEQICGGGLYESGEDLRHVSPQGNDCAGERCGYHAVRSVGAACVVGEDASYACRLFRL